MLKLQVLNSIEKFREIRDQWDKLLDHSNADNIFLTWEWQFNWWQAFKQNKELYIILTYDENNNLLGIAPLYIAKNKILYRELRFIGYGTEVTSEYLDFICYKDREEEIIGHFLELILNKYKPYDVLVLANMLGDSKTIKFIIDYIYKNKLYSLEKEDRPFCPIIRIPLSWESYFSTLSRNMRYNLRSSMHKLEKKFTVKFNKFNNIYDGNGAFEQFQHLYSLRRNSKKEKNKYISKNYRDFQENITRAISDKNWLHLSLLSLNKNIVAAMYSFQYKNKIYAYQIGYDDNYAEFDVSHNLIRFVLEDAMNSKINELDLLRGEEWYKLRWANEIRKKNRIIVSNSLLGNILIANLKIKSNCINIIKQLLPKNIAEAIDRRIYE